MGTQSAWVTFNIHHFCNIKVKATKLYNITLTLYVLEYVWNHYCILPYFVSFFPCFLLKCTVWFDSLHPVPGTRLSFPFQQLYILVSI